MKTARDIYREYKIMPSLQLHQLRVAAVAKLVCENFEQPIDEHSVTLACLFHDMGNILKFDLTVFSDFVQPEGIEYWQGIKEEFASKYGNDQHAASLRIAREIGLSDTVAACIDIVAFSKIEELLASGSWEQKVCEYADARVAPTGVLPLEERLEEGRKRYMGRSVKTGVVAPRERFDALLAAGRKLEKQIFEHSRIQPEDITDAAVAPVVEELRNYSIA